MRSVSRPACLRCDGVSRRDFLHLGALSCVELSLADLFRFQAVADSPRAKRDLSCILIWLDGGPSHIETFDPKPDAPIEVRGEFKPIQTKIPGMLFSENMKRLAAISDKLSIVRS